MLCLAALGLAGAAQAQDEGGEDNSYFVNLIQDGLSTDDRQIRLIGIDGLLSSDATVEKITVADSEGIWLTINEAEIIWSRLALLGGNLRIDNLTAASIEITRRPVASGPSLPSPEARKFEIPELPLSVNIAALEVGRISLAEAVAGHAAEISVSGALSLEEGGLDARLDMQRLDMAGAFIKVAATYAPGGDAVSVDLEVSEPANGLLATVMAIPDRPALDLTVKGSGAVDNLALDIALLADKSRQVEGTLQLDDAPGGLGFDLDVEGRLSFMVGPEIRPFFSGESRLRAAGRQLAGGGFALDTLSLKTAALGLDGSLETTPDGFLRRAQVEGNLGDGVSQSVLPFGDGAVSVREARLRLDFGNRTDNTWTGSIAGTALIAGDISAAELDIALGGVAEALDDPANRVVTLTAEGGLRGVRGATPDLSRALGQALDIVMAVKWRATEPVAIDVARISGNGTELDVTGVIEDLGFTGEAAVRIDRLEPFAGLSGRDLKGGMNLALKGRVEPLTGSFDLTADGTSQALKLDIGQADALLAGQTRLTGRVLRDENGFRTNDLSLSNDQMELRSDGFLASDAADLSFSVDLNDMRDLTRQARGALRVDGTAKGQGGIIALETAIRVDDGVLLDRPLRGMRAGFTGGLERGTLTGLLSGVGRFGEGVLSLVGQVQADASRQELRDFLLRVGPSALSGDLLRDQDGFLTGAIDLASEDISDLAALALQDAGGRVNARLAFQPNDLGQQITAQALMRQVTMPGAEISNGEARVIVQNAFGVPGVIGTAEFGKAQIGGVAVRRGRAGASLSGKTTRFDANVDLENGTELLTGGTLTAMPAGYALELERLDLRGTEPGMALRAPAQLVVNEGGVEVRSFDLGIGAGSVTARGRINDGYDMALEIAEVPLAIGNAIVDDLGARGTVSGTARLSGTRSAPQIAFDLAASEVSSTLLAQADLPPFELSVTGESEGNGLRIGADLSGPANFDATVAGYVPLDGGQADLEGKLSRFPLALIDRVAGKPGLRGTVDGTFGIAGRLNRPRVRFDLDGAGLSAAVVRENGIPPFAAEVEGSFFNDTITLPVARITGGGGMNFSLSGRIPLGLDGLDVAAEGIVPLSVANVAMARSGMRASGNLDIDARASGRLSAPVLSGRANLSGGTFTASRLNLRLEQIDAALDLSADRVSIRSLSARGSRGGRVSASGYVSIDPRAGLPADIDVRIRELNYTDAKLITATISGDLALRGALSRSSTLSGDVTVSPLEIAIPSRLPRDSGFSIDVRHVNASPAVRRTLARAANRVFGTSDENGNGRISLDLTVSAPNQVFVRGRGLDAELGGTVRVTGTLPNYKPNGRFDLIRGRLALLGQRIDLTSGAILLTGTKIPDLMMEARVVTGEVEATFSMEGAASAPEMRFSSVPDLPDDEILARVLFRRSISELSPLQVARLAAAVGQLAGRTGSGVIDQIREATGLDDLDFRTGEDGTTTVQAGKYIQDNIYSTIEADNLGNSRATINLDINDHVTARGALDNSGNTSFGVFFEKDY